MVFDKIIWLEEIDSTQDFLKSSYLKSGTVAVAKRQHKGRGRSGNTWISQEGGLYFSILLNQDDIASIYHIPLIMGLAISRFLENMNIDTFIKWPNDVFCRGKKICGILTENTKGKIIIGIGLNVNQTGFPDNLSAISIYQITGKILPLPQTLLGLLPYISSHIELFKEKGFSPLKYDIEDRLLFKGSEVIVKTNPPTVGILKGLSDKGALLIESSEGEKEIFGGEFTLRPLL